MFKLTLALFVALAAPALAQSRTWIVDAANGAGTTHLDIPAAVSIAVDWDTIIVRPHPLPAPWGYRTATTNQGITIVGLPGARFTTFNSQPFTVTGLAQGRDFTMQGMEFAQSVGVAAISLNQCAGRVHLDRLTLSAVSPNGTLPAPGVGAQDCAQVTMSDCAITGSPAVQSFGVAPSVAISGSTLTGTGGRFQAVEVYGVNGSIATLMVTHSHCVGGVNGTTGEGIHAVGVDGNVTLSGDSIIEAHPGSSNSVSAVRTYAPAPATTVRIAPEVQLIPRNGAPAVCCFGPGVIMRLPALRASGAGPGGTVSSTLSSPAGELVILLFSAPYDRITVPPFGDLWFDPLVIFFVTASFQGSSEHWTVDVPLSPSARRGEVFAIQGLSGPGLDVKLSNPVVVTIN